MIAAALIGAGTLTIEIGLTRLYSVLLYYNYVFLVLAVALLGLGLGGAIAALMPERRQHAERFAAGAAAVAAAATAVTTLLSARALPPAEPLLHAAAALVPFMAAGVALPLLLSGGGEATGRIYASDLAGAAGGGLLAFGLLQTGAVTTVLGGGALFALAAWVIGRKESGSGARTLLLGGAAALVLFGALIRPLDLDLDRMSAGKPLANWLRQGQATLMRSTWDPFSRVDVVATQQNPDERLVFVDGAAGSSLPRYPADTGAETKRRTELGFFPYQLVPAKRSLVIGSGGGLGVLYAVLGGVPDITAVEVSPGVVDAVRAYGDYDGFLYDRPDVHVVVQEGRAFLESDDSTYDVIDLSLVVSLATSQSGYALTENDLFTTEAFLSIYDHLSDDGVAAIRLYDDPTLTRAVNTAAAALRLRSGSDQEAMQHLVVLFNPKEVTKGSPAFYPQLLISKRPLTRDAAAALLTRAGALGFTVMFSPYTKEEGAFGKVARGETSLAAIQGELTGGEFSPPTDARPFFFEMEEGLPRQLKRTWIAVAVVIAAASAALILLIHGGRFGQVLPARRLVPALSYFGLLGIGFMLIELALLARLSLVLGHPTVVLTTVLIGMLLAGGLGSFLSHRLSLDVLPQAVPPAGIAVTMLALAVPALLNAWRGTIIGWPQPARIAIVLTALLPLGAAMGVLFPSGLRLAGIDATLPWAVNGVASVVGSVLATTLAIELGYPAVTRGGAGVYLLVALAGPLLLGHSLQLPDLAAFRGLTRRRAPGESEATP